MENQKPDIPPGKVSANPTKKFFMSMLTRDIALIDAIMDLLDNCIDGIHRKRKGQNLNGEKPYEGFFGEIRIDGDSFTLKDNCGGIPLDVAINYAFKMGRSEEYKEDDNLETVGMYGIGMKRAVFKMGMKAEIISNHQDDSFKVDIPEDWSSKPDWFFEYTELAKEDVKAHLLEEGTVIRISKLHQNISSQFKDKAGFLKDLAIELEKHYGYIVDQGFKIELNGVAIKPLELNILTFEEKEGKNVIRPYVYTSKIDNVDLEIIVGFYRPLATDEEIENELQGTYAKSQTENAGVTIICNDRVVLYCDKTFLTGWGEPPVPKYHTQFIAIAGVVHFKSTNPINLPVTTTKRGLDTSSSIYAEAKNRIKEGLKLFTSFTNNWKAPSEERAKLFENPVKINALRPGQTKSNHLIKLVKAKKEDNGEYQIPALPKPNEEIRTKFATITFTRDKESIDAVNNFFLDGEAKTNSEVGAWCFDQFHSQLGS